MQIKEWGAWPHSTSVETERLGRCKCWVKPSKVCNWNINRDQDQQNLSIPRGKPHLVLGVGFSSAFCSARDGEATEQLQQRSRGIIFFFFGPVPYLTVSNLCFHQQECLQWLQNVTQIFSVGSLYPDLTSILNLFSTLGFQLRCLRWVCWFFFLTEAHCTPSEPCT